MLIKKKEISEYETSLKKIDLYFPAHFSMVFNIESNDTIWYHRSAKLVVSIENMFKRLPKTENNNKIESFIPFEVILAYEHTKCFPMLSKTLLYLPGFVFDSFDQDYGTQEMYGFGLMTFDGFLKDFDNIYIDKELSISKINQKGSKYLIDKFIKYKNKDVDYLVFNNGAINFKNQNIVLLSEDEKDLMIYFESKEPVDIIKDHKKDWDEKKDNLAPLPDYYELKKKYKAMSVLTQKEMFFKELINKKKKLKKEITLKEKDIDFIMDLLNISEDNKNFVFKFNYPNSSIEAMESFFKIDNLELFLEFDEVGYLTESSKEIIELNIAY